MHTPSATLLHESYRQLLRLTAACAALAHLGFIALFARYGVTEMAWLNVASVACHLYAYWQAGPGGSTLRASNAMGGEVFVHAVAATLAIGWQSGFHYLLIPIIPVGMLSTARPLAPRLAVVLGTAAAYLGLLYWSGQHPPWYTLPPSLLQAMKLGCLALLFGSFMAMAARYRKVIVQAQDTLARDAFTDPLTGALNRRRLAHEVALLPVHARPSALLLCDLDHFKQVNDHYGHDAGDQVLRAFYEQVKACMRSGDHVCRWGGEEFLVLLPQTDMETARQVAHRLRAQVEGTPVALDGGKTLDITVTIGLARLHTGEHLQTAIQRADTALYRGKAAGRNQVHDSTQSHDSLADLPE